MLKNILKSKKKHEEEKNIAKQLFKNIDLKNL